MKIVTNFNENSGLIPYHKLLNKSMFVMPETGTNGTQRLFIKINDGLAFIFKENGIEEFTMLRNIWVRKVEEINIDICLQ